MKATKKSRFFKPTLLTADRPREQPWPGSPCRRIPKSPARCQCGRKKVEKLASPDRDPNFLETAQQQRGSRWQTLRVACLAAGRVCFPEGRDRPRDPEARQRNAHPFPRIRLQSVHSRRPPFLALCTPFARADTGTETFGARASAIPFSLRSKVARGEGSREPKREGSGGRQSKRGRGRRNRGRGNSK